MESPSPFADQRETLERMICERTASLELRACQLQALAVTLFKTRERERGRIADILHDDLQQVLACARMRVQSAFRGACAHNDLKVIERLLDESIRISRSLLQDLMPSILRHADLVDSLEWLAQQMRERHSLSVCLETEGIIPAAGATVSLKSFLFRAVQELLLNVVRHAGVTSARVILKGLDDALQVIVADRGRGFDPRLLSCCGEEPRGIGLIGIREIVRSIGGRLDVESRPGWGSRFTLTVPYRPAKPGRYPDGSDLGPLGAP